MWAHFFVTGSHLCPCFKKGSEKNFASYRPSSRSARDQGRWCKKVRIKWSAFRRIIFCFLSAKTADLSDERFFAAKKRFDTRNPFRVRLNPVNPGISKWTLKTTLRGSSITADMDLCIPPLSLCRFEAIYRIRTFGKAGLYGGGAPIISLFNIRSILNFKAQWGGHWALIKESAAIAAALFN